MSLPGKARLIEVPTHSDARGTLFVAEQEDVLPFRPVRMFAITAVPAGAHRAQHIVSCDQFLWMAAGSCMALVKHEGGEGSVGLRHGGPGLYLPEGCWLDLWDFSPGSVMIVLAAGRYRVVPRG
jgi:hypothetical protein